MIGCVLGRRGCGKTTEIKKRLAKHPRLLIYDTLAEYGEFGTVVFDPVEMIDLVASKQKNYFQVVFQPMELDAETSFEYFMRTGWIAGDCTLVVDEIDAVSSPVSIPVELSRNIRYGRHRNVNLIAASRRAAEVPRLLTSQSDEIVFFNCSEPADVDYIAKITGKETAQRIARLPKFRSIVWTPWQKTLDNEPELEEDRAEPESATPPAAPDDNPPSGAAGS